MESRAKRKNMSAQQTQNICITFIQRRPNVFDVGPTLYKTMQMFCVHWVSLFIYQLFNVWCQNYI